MTGDRGLFDDSAAVIAAPNGLVITRDHGSASAR